MTALARRTAPRAIDTPVPGPDLCGWDLVSVLSLRAAADGLASQVPGGGRLQAEDQGATLSGTVMPVRLGAEPGNPDPELRLPLRGLALNLSGAETLIEAAELVLRAKLEVSAGPGTARLILRPGGLLRIESRQRLSLRAVTALRRLAAAWAGTHLAGALQFELARLPLRLPGTAPATHVSAQLICGADGRGAVALMAAFEGSPAGGTLGAGWLPEGPALLAVSPRLLSGAIASAQPFAALPGAPAAQLAGNVLSLLHPVPLPQVRACSKHGAGRGLEPSLDHAAIALEDGAVTLVTETLTEALPGIHMRCTSRLRLVPAPGGMGLAPEAAAETGHEIISGCTASLADWQHRAIASAAACVLEAQNTLAAGMAVPLSGAESAVTRLLERAGARIEWTGTGALSPGAMALGAGLSATAVPGPASGPEDAQPMRAAS